MKEKIVVIGAGTWGSAIANLISENSYDTHLISNDIFVSQEINLKNSNNKFLPNINLNKNLKSSINLEEEIVNAKYIFIATPSNSIMNLILKLKNSNLENMDGFILATKGLDHDNLKLFHQVFENNFPNKNFAILSGPNFAMEVAQKMPTVTNIASRDKKFADEIIKILENSYFKAKYNDDIITTEICGIVKNIIAIACGICDGLNLGQNTKSIMILQGINEIHSIAKVFDAKGNINNAAGFGDIFLTCSSVKSRNNSLGISIANGEKYKDISSNKTFEGAINAASIAKLSEKLKINLPLCQAVNRILNENISQNEIRKIILNLNF